MKTVGITGTSGFIGKHVAAAFRDAGLTVRAFAREAASPDLIPLDYLDAESLARALDGVDAVVHIAGLAHVSPKSLDDPLSRYRESNVGLSVAMMKASIRAGVGQFVLLSSAGVLGQASPPGGFDDSSPAMPYDMYTISKFEAEQRVAEAAKGNLSLTILRPPMVYGRDAPGSYRRFCNWIDRGLPLPLARIAARRSVLGIRNLCDLLVTIATSARQIPHEFPTLLVADSEPITVAEFARQIALVRGRRARLLPIPPQLLELGLRAAGLQEEYRRLALPFELMPARARALFDWRPPYTTSEELAWALVR
ncbi:MAG TPA: NAD-dependent epimerase/dehydratase family protein [Steroidobacteraceae bacterium]|jgi:nucleoside-diphosphate-sugar epimerase|nr:NAD-dependent epimerase/dehydratase family protein [Steroidobacteraceae bacterium]